MSKPVEWARQYAATIKDAGSLRHMLRFAQQDIAENERIRNECRKAGRGAVIEWNRLAKPQDAESREAIRLCRAGLRRLGVTL